MINNSAGIAITNDSKKHRILNAIGLRLVGSDKKLMWQKIQQEQKIDPEALEIINEHYYVNR